MTEPLAWSHRVSEIPEPSLREARTASPDERLAIANSLDIVACDALECVYTIRSLGQGRYRMRGTVKARVTQRCVVTLEPLSQEIAEHFDVEFWPPGTLPDVGDAEVEVLSVPEIEPIPHGMIEAGRVIGEIVAAALDPYPRKADASLEWQEDDGAAAPEESGPFAALKKLKK